MTQTTKASAKTPAETPEIKQTGRVCERCNTRRPMVGFRRLTQSHEPVVRDTVCLACRQKEEDEAAQSIRRERVEQKKVAALKGAVAKDSRDRDSRQKKQQLRKRAVEERARARALRKKADGLSEVERELAGRELARRRLLRYIERFQPGYMAGWVHEDICRRLEKFVEDVEKGLSPRLMLWVPPRHGKECASSTPVLTANRGWITHAELVPGDKVFHPSGRAIEVLARGEDNPHSPKYEVELTDGSTVRVHPNHEWTVYQRGNDRVSGWKTVETRYLASRNLWSGKRAVFQLPVVQAVEYPPQQLVMPPYVLGAWLGDGTATGAELTHHPRETEVVQAVVEAGYCRSRAAHYFSAGSTRTVFGGSGMTAQLRAMQVWGNKHIPQAYKRGSVSQRLELLAGLIDTDGHVEPGSSRVRISTASTQLRDDIAEVVRSLGFRPYIHEVVPSCSSSGVQGSCPVYQIGFQPTLRIPTRLRRKAITRLAPQRRIGIRAVRETAPETGQCIQVDHPDGLYLVGRNLTPTHNSLIASDYLPSWALGKHPEWEIIASSYSKDLPMKFSRNIRERLSDKAYQQLFQKTRLDPKVTSAEEWRTTAGGGYRAAGVGGGITGMGAHILIIDDPVKDAEEADSETVREKTWDWYGSTAYTRLAPGGGLLVIQTRWHDDDLSGRLERHMQEGRKEAIEMRAAAEMALLNPSLSEKEREAAEADLVLADELEQEVEPWEIVKYPAVATHDEYITRDRQVLLKEKDHYLTVDGKGIDFEAAKARLLRKKGEALHPKRFDLTRLRRTKRTLQPRHWSALYQQNPVPDEGLYFQKDMFRWEPCIPDYREMLRFNAWDLAIGTRQTSDWTVGIAGALDWEGRLHIIDLVRMRTGNVAEIADAVVRLANRTGAEMVGVEKGQLELALAPALKAAIAASKTWRAALAEGQDALKPVTDKLMRARPLQGMMQQGAFYLPSDQEWAQTLVAEFLRFPGGLHDDIVDAAAWLARMVLRVTPPDKPGLKHTKYKSWRDKLKEYQEGTGRHPMAA